MLVPHQELPAADSPQPMEGEGLAILSAIRTRFRSDFPLQTCGVGFAAVVATASGSADGARDYRREPAL
jgi:hypothetical protein